MPADTLLVGAPATSEPEPETVAPEADGLLS